MVASVRSLSNLTGLVLSVGCVIHCMVMPVLLASLPSSGGMWLSEPIVHQVLGLLGIGIGVWTLIPGWRGHRRHSVLLLAGIGLLVMNYAAFFGEDCCGDGASLSDGFPACCHAGACPATGVTGAADDGATNSGREATASALLIASWLWHHPTACGAALLAWAHCLNGACRKHCCRVERTMLREAEFTLPHDPNRIPVTDK